MFKQSAKTTAVFTQEFDQCWKAIQQLHTEQKALSEAKNFMVLGVSGVGKSTLIGKYQEKYNDQRSKSAGRMPIVSFSAPAAPTPKALMQAINRAFGGPVNGTSAELMQRALQYVNHFKVEVLFMDEAHHLIDRGRMKTHAHLGDCWKEFSDQVQCCIGMCGAPRLKLLFETNNQLRNRWSSSFALRPFPYDGDQQPLAEFLLTLIHESALESEKQFLLQYDTINRIQYATDGVPALVVKLLLSLKKVMLGAGGLDMTVLDRAWSFHGTANLPSHRRPFDTEFNFERLMGYDEPFYPSSFDGDNHAVFS